MEPQSSQSPDSAPAQIVAAVDVGANALRMVIAEVFPDGRIEVLERLQRAVRLGQDTFRRGRLGGQSMRAAIGVLRDFRRLLDLYKVEKIRAVATSAVREAGNGETFLDRVFMATRLQVEAIDPSEESRLTVSAVRQAVGNSLGVNERHTLIVDVGGGSTLLTMLENGEISTSQSLRLGSIRLRETLSTSDEPPRRSAVLLRQHISNTLSVLENVAPLGLIDSFVAVGGDARFAAREIGAATAESNDLAVIEAADFDKLVAGCVRHTSEELSKLHGLPFADAETLNPALLVYQVLLKRTQADKIIVSHVSMRDGLLLDLGISSPQVDDPARGFSFLQDGPLDMRMDPTRGMSARQWLEHASEQEIAEVLKRYGDERFAVPIAAAIVARRGQAGGAGFQTTRQLADVVAAVVRRRQKRPEVGKNPATRTFQALRIHVNDEGAELSRALAAGMRRLVPGGRLAVISFHSIEDRMVKQFISLHSGKSAERHPVTGAPLSAPSLVSRGRILPGADEVKANPRARSAVLRVAERTEAEIAP